MIASRPPEHAGKHRRSNPQRSLGRPRCARPSAAGLVCGLALLALLPTLASAAFVTFESGQVRPLALAPGAPPAQLYAVNTPDNRLEIFDLGPGGPTHAASVPVGLEPVAVAARTAGEVWVVNHLSDSISIVDVAASPPRVVRTLLVGDEPRDIVFAGPGGTRAFVTTAHRGQNSPVDPQLTTEGVGRADVWVFDATNLGTPLGGTPLTIVTLFGDTPRALAASPDGTRVYAAVLDSGNQTTVASEGVVCNGGASAPPCSIFGTAYPGGLPAPNLSADGVTGPETGLIVKLNPTSGNWEDRLGRNWNNAVRFDLPDLDVFEIDATTNPPVEVDAFAHVGTVLYDMAVNPVSGVVYVTNTDAHNEVRFEGPGGGGSTVRGHLHEARVSVIDAGGTVTPRHLNPHIDYGVIPSPPGTADDSLSMPLGMAVSGNGQTLYVAAFGSSKVGVFSTAALEAGTFVPSADDHIEVSGGGPSGLVLDEARQRLYVLTRFDDAISVVDTTLGSEVGHLRLHDPEPASVRNGRPVLYDARLTSSNGEASCAVCHVFADFDSLAWDLGNPDDVVHNDPNPRRVVDPIGLSFPNFHPLKGPMTTQSLRGMANSGPMHWRGDRTGGNDPGGDPLDEDAAFKKFIVAFGGLLGRDGPISDTDMQRFTNFILQVTYPPNPIRALDDSLTPDQQAGRNFFFGPNSDVFENCDGCHRLDPAAGFFGTDGFSSFEFEPQFMKIPHLRNLYQKVGMFGMPAISFVNQGDNGHKGPQVRGFGFLHDGSTDTLFRFHDTIVFNQTNPGGFPLPNPGGFPSGAAGDTLRRQVEQFMLAFDSNLAPIVGQQVTATPASDAGVDARIALLLARAAAGDCELVAKGSVGGEARGWVRRPGDVFQSDRAADPLLSPAALRALATTPGQELTYTCVPPGSGERIGVDRDGDGFFDADELDAGTDPADPASFPGAPAFALVPAKTLKLRDRSSPADPARRRLSFAAATKKAAPANRVVPPPRGSSGDPTLGGASLVVYDSAGLTTDQTSHALAAAGWKTLGSSAKPKGYRYVGKDLPGPITTVVVKDDKLTVKGKGSGLAYSLDEPAQGSVAVRLVLGSGPGWCADVPAKATGNPPSTARSDRVDRFVGQPKAPAPPACPALPGGSPSGAFVGG